MTAPTTPFRITIAPPDALREIEASAPADLKNHLDLIKRGLEEIPGVPGEAIYGAVTLRALALKPDLFRSWFLTEHYSVKHGEVDKSAKELLAMLVSRRIEEDETPTCAPYHAAAARYEGASDDAIRIVEDYDAHRDELPENVREVIDFGLSVAFDAKSITDADVQRLQSRGYSDAALVEIVSTALIAHNLATLNQVFNLIEGQG